MSADSIVIKLKALADPTRLQIFEFLRNCCCEVAMNEQGGVGCGCKPTVGEVCCHVLGEERIPSSLSFHLKELRVSGLINTEKEGKFVRCAVNREAVFELAQFFGKHEICCAREEN